MGLLHRRNGASELPDSLTSKRSEGPLHSQTLRTDLKNLYQQLLFLGKLLMMVTAKDAMRNDRKSWLALVRPWFSISTLKQG